MKPLNIDLPACGRHLRENAARPKQTSVPGYAMFSVLAGVVIF